MPADRQMVASSSDQFVATCDHLTDYSFNVLSFYTNNSMERLSIVTVVFLRKFRCQHPLSPS